MAAKRRPSRPDTAADPLPVVVACRGGDCGSRAKHPGVDHAGLLRQLQERMRGVARVVPSACLDACDHSNVTVVVPADADEEPVWIGDVNEPDVVDAICDLVTDGGPGVADEPIEVELRRFQPTRRNRAELEHEQGRVLR